jgi:hypothetical protein
MIQRRIVCAAIRFPDGLVVCGPRHHNAIFFAHDNLKQYGHCTWCDVEQGFVDQQNVFLTREEAWHVAYTAGQIIRNIDGDMRGSHRELFSEHLY